MPEKLTDRYPETTWSGGLLSNESKEQWWHISVGSKTAKFRLMRGEARTEIFDLDVREEDRLEDCRDWLEGKLYWPWAELKTVSAINSRPAYDQLDRWANVIDAAVRGEVEIRREVPTSHSDHGKKIPITVLRRFYETLRMLNTQGLHQQIAAYLSGGSKARRARRIADLWQGSLDHLKSYLNTDDSFLGARDPLEVVEGNDKWAQKVVSRASQGKICFEGETFKYLARELSPLRTTGGASFEDGVSGRRSGTGGIDVLFRSQDNVPIIGEVKASTDVGPLLAFVQSLAYAVELVPSAQRSRRMSDHVSDQLVPDPTNDSGHVEILLILEDEVKDKAELEAVHVLTQKLLEEFGDRVSAIRRVSAAKVEMGDASDGNHGLNLKKIWSISNTSYLKINP